MNINKQKIILFLLFIFSSYCVFSIGRSWDEFYHLELGKATYQYLFSFGKKNNDVFYREFYSAIYWSIQYFITQIFFLKFKVEILHFLNLIFAFATLFGIGKISGLLFNKYVGKISFIILFFYPIFFGHMGFNPKDTILAFCHVWIFYLILKYIKKQNSEINCFKYIFFISLLAAISTGIQLVFLGSLITVILFILADIFIFKKITNNNFNYRKFSVDILLGLLIFYIILTIFWIDTHENIFLLQKNIFLQNLSEDNFRGWPFNLINGDYYYSNNITKFYFLINFIYKSPEYFIILYIIFFMFIFRNKIFFVNIFEFFYYKLLLIFLILLLPNLILFIIPFPVYDGFRLFLWAIPYYCIFPSLAVYFIIKNFNELKNKVIVFLLTPFILLFLYNFFILTPYQYTYLNLFTGNTLKHPNKFENDYWGGSIKELIKKSSFLNQGKKLSYCGINKAVIKFYLDRYNLKKIEIVSSTEDYDYIIMTNRTLLENTSDSSFELKTCFQKYQGENLSTVQRNGLVLSTIRKN